MNAKEATVSELKLKLTWIIELLISWFRTLCLEFLILHCVPWNSNNLSVIASEVCTDINSLYLYSALGELDDLGTLQSASGLLCQSSISVMIKIDGIAIYLNYILGTTKYLTTELEIWARLIKLYCAISYIDNHSISQLIIE